MKSYLSLIKFSHTIFAMPFAMVGFFIGVHSNAGYFDWTKLLLVVLCMVFARSAAMAFNRYIDREIDKKNPRTAVREIPSGVVSARSALFFVALNSALFVLATWFINPVCFFLSPVALAIILGYSYTKRFTWLCHFVLGLGLSLTPIGAYLAVTGAFDFLPLLYSGVVFFWVAGFDVIYALQDEEFDKMNQLHSIPSFLGKKNALALSNAVHTASGGLLILAGWFLDSQFPEMGWLHWAGVFIFVSLLIYQHILVKPEDLSRVNLAFFTTNGVASLIFGTLLVADFYL